MTPTYFHNLNLVLNSTPIFGLYINGLSVEHRVLWSRVLFNFFRRYSYILPFRLLTTLPIRSDHCAEKWGQTWSLGTEYAKILIIICSGKSKMVFFLSIESYKPKKQIIVNFLILPFRLLTPLPYSSDHCAGKWGKTWSLGSWPLQKIKSRATPPHSKWPLTLANKLRQMLLSSFLLSCPPFAKLTDQHYPFK